MKRIIRGLSVLGYVLSVVGSSLLISVSSVYAANATWDGEGADDNISTAANWAGDVAPSDGDTLIFPAATADLIVTNDSLVSIAGIVVLGGANPDNFTITIVDDVTTSTLSLSGTIAVGTAQNLILNQDVSLSADLTVNLADADTYFSLSSDNIDLGSHVLTFAADSFASITSATSKAELPQVSFGSPGSVLAAGLSGTAINAQGVDLSWYDETSSYIGTLTLDKSILTIGDASKIGANTAGITMNQSQINPNNTAALDFDEPLSINGNLFGKSSAEGFGYEAIANPGNALTISGQVTLLSDIVVDPYSGNITFSGDIIGNYLIGVSQVYTVTATEGHLIITSTNNESLTATGDYIVEDGTAGPVVGDSPGQSLIIESGAEVIINGTRGNVIVSPGATLKGTGTLDNVSVLGTATIAPGLSPGCLNLADLTFSSGAIYTVEVEGTVACTGFDQIVSTGAVNLNDATLDVVFPAAFRPAAGDVFTIIDASGIAPIVGTFSGLAEGATVTFDAVDFVISYVGGDGNDVTLTTIDSVILAAAPGAPDTGFRLIKGAGLLTLISTLLVTAMLIIFSRKFSSKQQ